MATDSVTVAEGTRIHKDYHTSLGVTLTNPYGTTSKAVPLDGQLAAQPTDGIEAASAAPAPRRDIHHVRRKGACGKRRKPAQGHIHSHRRHGRQQGPQESGGRAMSAPHGQAGPSPPPYGPRRPTLWFFLPKRQKKLAKSLHSPRKSSTFALAKKETHRGVEQLVARQAHNLEVACSSPASATPSKGAAIGCALAASKGRAIPVAPRPPQQRAIRRRAQQRVKQS